MSHSHCDYAKSGVDKCGGIGGATKNKWITSARFGSCEASGFGRPGMALPSDRTASAGGAVERRSGARRCMTQAAGNPESDVTIGMRHIPGKLYRRNATGAMNRSMQCHTILITFEISRYARLTGRRQVPKRMTGPLSNPSFCFLLDEAPRLVSIRGRH